MSLSTHSNEDHKLPTQSLEAALSASEGSSEDLTLGVMIGGGAVAIVVLTALAAGVACYCKKKKNKTVVIEGQDTSMHNTDGIEQASPTSTHAFDGIEHMSPSSAQQKCAQHKWLAAKVEKAGEGEKEQSVNI